MNPKPTAISVAEDATQEDLDRFVETLKTLGSPDDVVEMVIHTSSGTIRATGRKSAQPSALRRRIKLR